jgi:colanic acid/amylovoran biosynthesis glycosyltransferase
VDQDHTIVKLGYLCGQYPAVSHTFILREVEALRRHGIEIHTFSVRRASANHLLADADCVAFQTTSTILPPRWRRLLGAHLRAAATAHVAYLRTLALALRLSPPGLRGRLWQLFYFVESVVLWDECRRRGIRHIHVHFANVAADVALLATELGSATVCDQQASWSFTMHGPTEFYDVSRFRLSAKVQHARFVVCISDYARSQLMSLCDPTVWNKLHVIHCGVPLDQFTNLQMHESKDAPTVVCVGRMVPEKGQTVLLEAVALLARRNIRIQLKLAGEGRSRAPLERLAEDLGLASQVTFVGAIGQEAIHALYAEAAIFCLPSFAEGVPCVLMEAMAMQVPVVSTLITGVPELIDDGRTGLLVTPGRADQLADALERLLSDPALCREMTSAARDKVTREFNTEISAEQLYELFVRQLEPVGTRPAVAELAVR